MTSPSSRTFSSSLGPIAFLCMKIGSARTPKPAREPRALPRYARSSQCPFLRLDANVPFLWRAHIVRHHGDEQIGNARAAHLTQCFELDAVNVIEQQHASPENRTFVHRFEGACGSEVL